MCITKINEKKINSGPHTLYLLKTVNSKDVVYIIYLFYGCNLFLSIIGGCES